MHRAGQYILITLLTVVAVLAVLGIRPVADSPSSLIEWISGGNADRTDPANRLLAPGAAMPDGGTTLLGTDQLGRSLALRLCLGLGTALMIAGSGALVAMGIGTAVGTTAALAGGRTDRILMRLTEASAGVPAVLVVLVLVAALKPWGLWVLFASMGLLYWQGIARVVRARLLRLRSELYVEASRALGAGLGHRLRRHLLPGTMPLVLAYGSLLLPKLILLESLLSYLGVSGATPHSFGRIISGVTATLTPLSASWWPVIVPCCALALFVLILNQALDRLAEGAST